MLSHLWRRSPDQKHPLHEGPRGQVRGGRESELPWNRQETLEFEAMQPSSLCKMGRDLLGAGEHRYYCARACFHKVISRDTV